MINLVIGFIFMLISFIFIGSSYYDLSQEVKLAKKMSSALYETFGFKYNNRDVNTRFFYDDESWVPEMKKQLSIGEGRVFYSGEKSLRERVTDLENKCSSKK